MDTITKRNVLLVVLPYLVRNKNQKSHSTNSLLSFPYGVLSMATYLRKQAGGMLNIQVLDCNINLENGKEAILIIKEKLIEFNPNIVGLSLMFDLSYKYVKDISAAIKAYNKDTVVVMGGEACNASYARIINDQENIDGVCFYEGEIPFLGLAISENMPAFLENDISWITRKSVRSGRIPQKKSVVNLDEVIDIDYTFVDVTRYGMEEAFSPFAQKVAELKQFFLVTSRGCPYICNFCMHSADSDKSMRYASIEAIVKHLKFLVSEYGMNMLTIYDDQLVMNKARTKRLFKELAQFKLRIECPNGLTPAFMDEEMIELMAKAGMDTVCLAIESGSAFVLNKIIHKPLSLKQVKPVVESCHKHNIFVQGYFVVGLPGEREEDRDETIRWIKEMELDWANFNLAVPLRGTELFRLCKEKGYIDDYFEMGELGMHDYVIRVPGVDPEYIKRRRYLMNLDVNFVNNYRMKMGDYKIAALTFKDIISRYDDHAFAYYYLSMSLSALGETQQAQEAKDKCNAITEREVVWQEYATYFNIS